MVIRPRSLEEIAAEQASDAKPPVAAAPVTTPTASPAKKADQPWDPFAEESPAAPEEEEPPLRRTPDLWKPVEEPKDLHTRVRTWGLTTLAIAVTFSAVWLAFNFSQIITSPTAQALVDTTTKWLGPPQPMAVSVTLINECPFSEKAFMAKVTPDGPTAEFVNGKASIQALPNQRIKLIANTKFPDFHYETGSIPIAPEVSLVANCDSMEERAKAISESLREAFKK